MKLSIIVPVYNAEKHLEKCLNSLINQNIKDNEIILVDDGSVDQSIAIIEDLSTKNKNIKYFCQKNKGPGEARNLGLKYASGEYIGFVDADDFIEQSFFEKAITKMEQFNADICITNPYIYEEKTEKVYPYRNMVEFCHLSKKGLINPMIDTQVFSYIGCWDKIYKRKLIEDNGIEFPPTIYEDHLFSYKSLASTEKVVVLDENLYYYRKGAGESITDKEIKNDKYKKDFLIIINMIKNILNETGKYDAVAPVYLKYILKDGMFHNCNSTSYKFFKEFFCGLSSLIDEKDFDIVKKLDIKKYTYYCEMLINKKVLKCRFKIRTLLQMDENDELK